MKQEENQELRASLRLSQCAVKSFPSERWEGRFISSYTEAVPEYFKMKMFVYRVVYLKQFPYDAMQLEKETLSDDSPI